MFLNWGLSDVSSQIYLNIHSRPEYYIDNVMSVSILSEVHIVYVSLTGNVYFDHQLGCC